VLGVLAGRIALPGGAFCRLNAWDGESRGTFRYARAFDRV